MYQIDWDAKLRLRSQRLRSQSLAIVTLISFVISLQIIPSAIFAETEFAETQSTPSLLEDTPEEVLRTEIYTDGRSPIDGTQLTATEYVELMENLRSLDHIPPEDLVPSKFREVIDLLRLRKFLRQFIPLIP